MNLPPRVYAILALLLAGAVELQAQAQNESPYSSSTVDTPPGENFMADNGLILVCLAIFVAVAIFLVLKGRRRV